MNYRHHPFKFDMFEMCQYLKMVAWLELKI
jgi:hypothetical protein